MTRIGWSAHSANSFARVTVAAWVAVEARRPLRVRHLAGMVGYVAGDHCSLALRLDHHADVARRVAGGWRQPHLGRDARGPSPPVRPDRRRRSAARCLAKIVCCSSSPSALQCSNSAYRSGSGPWGRSEPTCLHEHGVPAHMVDVQVSADYRVDAVPAPARLRQMLQERRRQRPPPMIFARLVVADAGVDHQPKSRRLHQQRLDGQQERPILLCEVRIEPGQPSAPPASPPERGRHGERDLDLDHASDLHRAHLPIQHSVLLSFT